MKIQDYIQVLKRRGWLIGLIAILTAGSALGFSLIQAPVYRSSVDIGIQAARTDWGLAQFQARYPGQAAGMTSDETTATLPRYHFRKSRFI